MKYTLMALGMLLIVGAASVAASETINVGNYSFTFNMTVPHQTQLPHDTVAVVKTFDGTMGLTDWSYSNLTMDEMVLSGSTYIGSLTKNVSDEGEKYGKIYTLPLGAQQWYILVFNGIELQSTMNLTQSVDFFKDVKISRIKS